MASKISLVGGADVWSPNNVLPWGGPWETSYLWYDPGVTYNSFLYPYDYRDEAVISANVTGLNLKVMIVNYESLPDDLGLSATVTDLTMYVITNETAFEDNLGLTATVAGVNLRDINIIYTGQPELLSLTATVTAVNLRVIVVSYTNWQPEEVSLEATVTGVKLT